MLTWFAFWLLNANSTFLVVILDLLDFWENLEFSSSLIGSGRFCKSPFYRRGCGDLGSLGIFLIGE